MSSRHVQPLSQQASLHVPPVTSCKLAGRPAPRASAPDHFHSELSSSTRGILHSFERGHATLVIQSFEGRYNELEGCSERSPKQADEEGGAPRSRERRGKAEKELLRSWHVEATSNRINLPSTRALRQGLRALSCGSHHPLIVRTWWQISNNAVGFVQAPQFFLVTML